MTEYQLSWPEGRSVDSDYPDCPECGHDFGRHSPADPTRGYGGCPECADSGRNCSVDQVAVFGLIAAARRRPPDWKQRHADACDAAVDHDLTRSVMRTAALNLGIEEGGLRWTALLRVAGAAAQVARAQALGFDPNLLRLTEDEANREAMRQAEVLVFAGVPTAVVAEADDGS